MKRQITLMAAMFIAALALGRVSPAADKPFDSRDEGFLKDTAQRDLLMIKLGDYAAQHAESQTVKDLGKQVAEDHRQNRQQVLDLAKENKTDLHQNEKLLPTQQEYYDMITRKPGIAFDKDYTKWLVAQHMEEIKQFQLERDHAHDVQVREYAGKTLPTLERHLKAGRDAQAKVWS
jgi:putative membrane protein